MSISLKVEYIKLFIITNYAMTPCCEILTKFKVISRSVPFEGQMLSIMAPEGARIGHCGADS